MWLNESNLCSSDQFVVTVWYELSTHNYKHRESAAPTQSKAQ